ncbi:MAG TPA: ATP-binding protein [Pseudonocardiaceae bacterium]|nr:ATP-binding protein [Pseudonocardiaceae bacterium]
MMDRRLRASGPGAFTRDIANLVADLAREAGLAEHDAYRLRLAADEITTNIAMHGYRGRCGMVEISGGVEDDWVWLLVVDEAPPFDPTHWSPSPRRAGDPVDGPVGGHGLFLALRSLDGFTYEYVAGRNRNMLWLRRSTADRSVGPRDSPVPNMGPARGGGG